MPKTFGAWLKAQQHRKDSIGDLAQDFITACKWRKEHPPAFEPEDLELQMTCLGACDAAYEALDAAAAEWRASQ